MFKPCIIIPIFNHSNSLEKKSLFFSELNIRCYLVNDGSTDSTASVIDELATRYDVVVIHRTINGGKGAAFKDGIAAATKDGYTHALQIDADDQHDINDVPKFLALAQQHPEEIIAGYPVYGESLPTIRKYSRYITHFWVWIETLSFAIRDSMCGFRVYPLATLQEFFKQETVGDRMDFDIEIIVKLYWCGVNVINVPTAVVYPVDGVSHFRIFNDNLLITRMHTRLVMHLLFCRLPKLILKMIAIKKQRHWSKMEERGSFFGLWFCVQLYRVAGRHLCLILVRIITAYFFVFGRKARAASYDYLETLWKFSGGITPKPSYRVSFSHFQNFSTCIIDRLSCWFNDLKETDFVDSKKDILLNQSLSGRGALLLCSHLGNVELASILAERLDNVHLNILAHTRHAEKINEIFNSISSRRNCEIFQVGQFDIAMAIHLHEKLNRGEWIIITCDRTPVTGSTHVTTIPFLGRMAPFSQGPFVLAILLGCPVYTLFCCKNENGLYEMHVDKFADVIECTKKNRAVTILEMQKQYVAVLEKMVVRYPLQWFNFFNFWTTDNDK